MQAMRIITDVQEPSFSHAMALPECLPIQRQAFMQSSWVTSAGASNRVKQLWHAMRKAADTKTGKHADVYLQNFEYV